MLDQISHAKLMEWAAYLELEAEEEKKAVDKAKNGGGGRKTTDLTMGQNA
jgi:hypothetical protein